MFVDLVHERNLIAHPANAVCTDSDIMEIAIRRGIISQPMFPASVVFDAHQTAFDAHQTVFDAVES